MRRIKKSKNIGQVITVFILMNANVVLAQVQLRDTVVTWQHHSFELYDDYSIKSYTTNDNDIQEVVFSSGKVLENDLIRLVLLPEYGGRVLSFFYKPTGLEYLYQSECGSAYGINENNFYYNWLMVYGGIFPTFPEPEHGKAWLLPWDYSVIKQTADTITVRMQYKDSTAYAGAPGQFNNGITNITCQVDVSVYAGSSLWDFDVKLINNEASPVTYEYWTCTTLAPGSESGETGTPLNSEMIIPVDQYFAGWSPGGWIGNFDSFYDFERIDFLSEWDDMGIAYAHNLNEVYWGVINNENEEGIFRISDNVETFGTKIWTWGSQNVDNNLYDWSNGGADNYIELWAGTSRSFFTDAQLSANETKSWTESYAPTVGMVSVDRMNDQAAVNVNWQGEEAKLEVQLNTFSVNQNYTQKVYLDDLVDYVIAEEDVSFAPLGHNISYNLAESGVSAGTHLLRYELYSSDNMLVLEYSELIDFSPVLAVEAQYYDDMQVMMIAANTAQVQMPSSDQYQLNILSSNGSNLYQTSFNSNTVEFNIMSSGVYIIKIMNANRVYTRKIYVR